MADLFSPDEIALITGQYGQGLGVQTPQGWGPQPAGSTDAAASTDGDGAAAAPAAPAATPWGGLGSLLGGGGGRGPGMSQGMIGLGLGLLAGNPFDRYSAALKGYQAGASQDEARWAQQQNEAYRQQALAQQAALQQQHMALQRELAYKPQVHFAEEEDPATGYKRARAFLTYPQTGKIQEIPLDTGERLANQGSAGATLYNPITQENM